MQFQLNNWLLFGIVQRLSLELSCMPLVDSHGLMMKHVAPISETP
jgi:hypothetical protein